MNGSTDSATKLLIAKKMDVDYFVYDRVKAKYSSDLWKFPLPDFVPDTGIMTEVFKNSDVVVYKIDQSKLALAPTQYASISKVVVNSDSAVVYVTNHASDPISLHIAWQDRYKPVTLNSRETKPVTIDLPKSSGSRFGFMPTLGSTSTMYVSLWMDPPSSISNSTTDARYAYPVDAVNINSQQLL
jgi:hypothetical protein